ncbi:MAG: DivIVA domain-containing protein, partial [Acidimicrobiia bacterium]|nr:DivIVA domain-containing protein [Acidimicrobiia bacterium]
MRQPGFGGRVWGYDRDEVDQLLASVVVSIERLQRRRQRDAEAIERATNEARRATERAKLADEAVADANRRAERLVAKAEARAEEARRELEAVLASAGGEATRSVRAPTTAPATTDDGHDQSSHLPLA